MKTLTHISLGMDGMRKKENGSAQHGNNTLITLGSLKTELFLFINSFELNKKGSFSLSSYNPTLIKWGPLLCNTRCFSAWFPSRLLHLLHLCPPPSPPVGRLHVQTRWASPTTQTCAPPISKKCSPLQTNTHTHMRGDVSLSPAHFSAIWNWLKSWVAELVCLGSILLAWPLVAYLSV